MTTKIHTAVGKLGEPAWLIATAAQKSGIGQTEALIEGFEPDYMLADRAYDADPSHITVSRTALKPTSTKKETASSPSSTNSSSSSEYQHEMTIFRKFHGFVVLAASHIQLR